jgi:crotonobetainyl-CoA:carnitine CoA-transferase CaiB-like acyl-CoA transferase
MSPARGNLRGTRVLDLSGEPGFLAGKLLGDLGADVIKVEPPGGDPARRRPPFWGGIPGPERSLLWLALNTSKRGMTLDVERPRGREVLLALAARADVVLETDPPGRLGARGLGWTALHAGNPRLILCSLTPFGQSGPRAGWRGSDLTVCAMSGNLYATGDPDRAPVRCSLPVSHYHGSIEAAVGVVFALLARERTGEGQHVDVALQEAMVMPNIGTAAMFEMTGNRGGRAGAFFRQPKSVAREIWPCKDGFVSFALRGGPARAPGLAAMVGYMDEHGMASPGLKAVDWKAHNLNLLGQAEVDALSREFAAFFLTKTMAELYRAACERNLMLAPINTAREIVGSAQLRAREFFVDVDNPGRGRLRYPGAFAITTPHDPAAPAIGIRRPAPRLGEHTAEVLAEIGLAAAEIERLRGEGVV